MMKITRYLLVISLVVLTSILGGCFFVTAQEDQAQRYSNHLLTNSAECNLPEGELTEKIPLNPDLSSTFCSDEQTFSDFAWKTFVALNWPADCSSSSLGSPLVDGIIGGQPTEPRVWEFYSSPANIFLEGGQMPIQTVVTPPNCGATNAPLPLKLSETAGEPDISTTLPGGKPLIDRWGNYILSESRINPVEVKQIIARKWYDDINFSGYNDEFYAQASDLTDPTTGPFALVCSKNESSPNGKSNFEPGTYPCREYSDKEGYDIDGVGAIEIKAAWMVLCDEPASCYRESDAVPKYDDYYTTKRTFQVETSSGVWEKVTVPVALVGFHIVYKTSRAGWVWSTFEHKNTAPERINDPRIDETTYNLFDKSYQGCPKNQACAEEPYLWRKNEFPHAVMENEELQISSQITREFPISQVAKEWNEKWQEKLQGSIWQNYQLIGTQWSSFPKAVEEFEDYIQPIDSKNLTNVTLEPYIKSYPQKRQSCIGCHELAKLPRNQFVHANFSFMLNK